MFFLHCYWQVAYPKSYNPVNNIPLPSHTHTTQRKTTCIWCILKYHSRWFFCCRWIVSLFFQWEKKTYHPWGVVYLPTWKPQISTIHVGKYTVRPMDPSWEKKTWPFKNCLFWGPPKHPCYAGSNPSIGGVQGFHRGGKKKTWDSLTISRQTNCHWGPKGCFETKGIFAHLLSVHVLRLVDLQIQKKGGF